MIGILEKLDEIFKQNGYRIYAVGGTIRDFLLGKEVHDFDFVTDATPSAMKEFLDADKCNFNFAKYGAIKYKVEGKRVDIVTLRKEEEYLDARHPNKIIFVNDLKVDATRRDFTINAIYMDSNGNLFDYYNGQEDLKNKILRCIGDSDKRMKEDPLRMIRACRFCSNLSFVMDEKLKESIKNNRAGIKKLNPQKILEEINKCEITKKECMFDLFNTLEIKEIIDEVLEKL